MVLPRLGSGLQFCDAYPAGQQIPYRPAAEAATASYAGLFMSARMQAVIDKYGYASAVGSDRFKKERESWTSAVYALGLAELTGKEYWVEIETVDQTPDARVHYIDQSAGYNQVNTQSIHKHVESFGLGLFGRLGAALLCW